LLGTVTEIDVSTGHDQEIRSRRRIIDGKLLGNVVSFQTQGEVLIDNGTHPYKIMYNGTVQKSEIRFTRQNDLDSHGRVQKFIAKRE